MSVAPRVSIWTGVIVFAATIGAVPAAAQTLDRAALKVELRDLRALQQQQSEALQATERRLARLEAIVLGDPDMAAPFNPDIPSAVRTAERPPELNPSDERPAPRRLDISGDLRLRYESNFGDRSSRPRGRGVLRTRLRADYRVEDWLTLGGQLATGDPDDPNSTDITLSSFDDDLAVSLDRAFAMVQTGDLTIWGGKFANPLASSDILWDGDVNPQGVAVRWQHALGASASARINLLYFLVDESAAGPDSDMVGAQAELALAIGRDLSLDLAAGYLDYSLRSLGGADAGDVRGNRLGPDGRYLSDFDIADLLVATTFAGFGEAWPVRFSGHYLKNLGALDGQDSALMLSASAGRASAAGDWMFGYSYSSVERDAVLAAYSNDNIALSTDYYLHGLSVDFAATHRIVLNATFYHYREREQMAADWQDRLRLNVMYRF